MALNAFGLPHVMGYLPTQAGEKPAAPLGRIGLMDAAVEMGLAGIEAPIPAGDPDALRATGAALQERDLQLVAPLSVLIDRDLAEIRAYLEGAAALGAKVVRAMLSSVLCGDRRRLEGGWEQRLARSATLLREILPIAHDLGLAIAIENHQDATSADLLQLQERVDHHPAYGVTLDTGNPLAVGEDPVAFARRVAPLIRHVHLKDYTIHFAPEGYRLVRCIAGTGVIDFPSILAIVRENGHNVLPGVEVAAQQTRTIPLLEDDWWSHYPPEQATHLPAALRVLWEKGRPQDEPYSSAWERGGDSATICTEEWAVVRGSVAYFHRLAAA